MPAATQPPDPTKVPGIQLNISQQLPAAAAYFLYGVQIEFSQTEIEPIREGKNKASSETPNLVLRSLNSKWKSVRIYFHILEVKILTWK